MSAKGSILEKKPLRSDTYGFDLTAQIGKNKNFIDKSGFDACMNQQKERPHLRKSRFG